MMAISLGIFSMSMTDAEFDNLLTLQWTFQLYSQSNELGGKVTRQTLSHELDIVLTAGLRASVQVCAIAAATGERYCELANGAFLDSLFPP